MISAIVAAAGYSSRMNGKIKIHLPFGNSTIIQTVIEALLASSVQEIIIIVQHQTDLPYKTANKLHYVVNPEPNRGLTSSIQLGVANAHIAADYLICLADMPLLTTDDYNQLMAFHESHNDNANKNITQPRHGNRVGNPVIFANAYRSEILLLTEPNGCKPIVQLNRKSLNPFQTENHAFFTDIDTMEDYQNALNRVS